MELIFIQAIKKKVISSINHSKKEGPSGEDRASLKSLFNAETIVDITVIYDSRIRTFRRQS